MISSMIAAAGLPLLTRIVKHALGRMKHPAAKGAAEALETVEREIAESRITPEELESARQHMQHMAALEIGAMENTVSEVNASLRREVASEDAYVRRMRPTFGYLMALTWTAQMLGVAYILIFRTDQAGLIMEAMESLSAIWGVALSVLGIYVYQRSRDKRLLHGMPQQSLFNMFRTKGRH